MDALPSSKIDKLDIVSGRDLNETQRLGRVTRFLTVLERSEKRRALRTERFRAQVDELDARRYYRYLRAVDACRPLTVNPMDVEWTPLIKALAYLCKRYDA